MKRKVGVKVLLFILFLAIGVFTDNVIARSEIPKASQFNGYVYDEVGVLSEDNIRYINYINQDLQEKTGGQIPVVIVNSLGDIDVKTYAVELFDQLDIGDKEKLMEL